MADLAAAIPSVPVAAHQTYGRVSREAAYMLLAKLYLNAEVYTGTAMYAECAEACKQVLATGIQLAPEYKYLFCGYNDRYVGNGEILWAAPQQVGSMESWGGTTYMTAGAFCDAMPSDVLAQLGCGFDPGVSAIFVAYAANHDAGPVVMSTGGMCDADYPVFRLADTYLMLAECEKRGVSGCDGLKYLNLVRDRAGLPEVNNYSLTDVLNERQCELYWEGFRRSDLIRFGLYTGSSYVWSWKGGVPEGAPIAEHRDLFAIPYQYVATVGQNPGY